MVLFNNQLGFLFVNCKPYNAFDLVCNRHYRKRRYSPNEPSGVFRSHIGLVFYSVLNLL